MPNAITSWHTSACSLTFGTEPPLFLDIHLVRAATGRADTAVGHGRPFTQFGRGAAAVQPREHGVIAAGEERIGFQIVLCLLETFFGRER